MPTEKIKVQRRRPSIPSVSQGGWRAASLFRNLRKSASQNLSEKNVAVLTAPSFWKGFVRLTGIIPKQSNSTVQIRPLPWLNLQRNAELDLLPLELDFLYGHALLNNGDTAPPLSFPLIAHVNKTPSSNLAPPGGSGAF